MFELSTFNVDKFLHTFIQNLRLTIKSPRHKTFDKIVFVTYVERSCKLKQQLLCLTEKLSKINAKENLDFSNEKDVRCFIEEHTCLLEKLISLSNTGILRTHLNNINIKILETVRKRKRSNESTKKTEIQAREKRNSLAFVRCKDKHNSYKSYKRGDNNLNKVETCENSKVLKNDTAFNYSEINSLKGKNDNRRDLFNRDLSHGMLNIAEKELEAMKELVLLYAKDVEHLKRNVEVTLYLTKKFGCNSNGSNELTSDEALCHYAIASLIVPSKKAFVFFEDDVAVVIEKYLSEGYKYRFDFQRDSEDSYVALLVLSQWAKVLVNHINTTMMRTISGILRCDARMILVLYDPKGKLL